MTPTTGARSGGARRASSPTTSASANGVSSSAATSFDMRGGTVSQEHAIVEGRKDAIGLFERGEREIVDRTRLHLGAQGLAAEQMLAGPSAGVLDGGAARHHESPVAGLREQQLAEGLRQCPPRALVGARAA